MFSSKLTTLAAILASVAIVIGVSSTPAYGKPKKKPQPPASQPDENDKASPGDAKSDGSKTVHLSEPAARMCAAAGGRLLVFHLKQAKQLAIVDLVEAKLVRSIDLPSDDICYAAGQDYLMVVFTGQKLLHRFSLKTFEREKTIPIPGDNAVSRIVIGSSSTGPLLLTISGPVMYIDPATMRPVIFEGSPFSGQSEERVSADGQTFMGWPSGLSPLHFIMTHLDGRTSSTRDGWSDGYNGAWLIPNADGSLNFRNGGVISTGDLKGVAADTFKGSVLMPTDSPAYFLSLRVQGDEGNKGNNRRPPRSGAKGRPSQVAICTTADLRTLYTVKNLEPMTSDSNYTQWGYFHGEPRVRYLPREKVLATVPESNDAVVVRRFDLDDTLKKSGSPFLFVVSKPAAHARSGDTYAYPLVVLSGAGGVKYHLESGPDGMGVSDAGQVSWKVPAAAAGTNVPVVVSLRDTAGKEVFHAFSIAVAALPQVAAAPPKPKETARPSASRPRERTIASAENSKPKSESAAKPVPAADGLKTVELPESFSQVCSGGSGRYLFFHLKNHGQIAMVDLVKGAIVHTFELSGQDALFAAGADSLVIVLPGQKVIQRWNLKTFRREKSALLTSDAPVSRVLMGCNSQGPLLVWNSTSSTFWDIETLKPMNVPVRGLNGDPHFGYEVRVSADGQSFTGWTSGITGQQFNFVQLEGQSTIVHTSPDGHSYNGWWAQPNADGSLVLRYGGGRYTPELKPLGGDDAFHDCVLLPTEDPRIFLSVHSAANNHSEVTICTTADCRRVFTIPDLEPMNTSSIFTEWAQVGGQPRVHYLPKERVLATLPGSNDRVVVRSFSLAKALEATGDDYLYVVSRPVYRATTGTAYEYQIAALAKGGKVKCHLESGPEGMTVSESGDVRWNVATRPLGGVARVLITVSSASGKEVQHAFEITVTRPGGAAEQPPPAVAGTDSRPVPRAQPGRMPRQGGGSSAAPSHASAADVVKVDDNRLELPSGNCAWVPGLGYRSMLFLSGDRLVVLGPDGITIQKRVKLPKAYVAIGERNDCYVALAADPKAVEVIDKKGLKVLKSLKLSCTEFSDLALHPTRPISYVAMKDLGKKPTNHFIVFNEKTGDGRESEEYVGTWIKPEPKGRFMMAGYRDIYEEGSRLLVNPGRIDVVPEYGDISWLIRYSLGADGMPEESEVKEKAGGNAQGIRLSKDGLRVTFLSHVGYPEFSGNLSGWDPKDLKKIPVTYSVKGKGTTYDLAYHPLLPLVASPGGNSAVFFHRETGDLEENRLTLPADGLGGAKTYTVQFSPDGKSLIFHVSVGDVHYLVKAALKLSAAELRSIDGEWKKHVAVAVAEPPEPAGEKVALKNFEALKGGAGKSMTTKDVGHWFMDSVVVIRSEDTAGTGFVVGSGGYIVTCAHCLPDGAKLTVSYRDSNGGAPRTRTAEPRIIAKDDQRDLALLKIDAPRALRPIRLAGGTKVESGEHVAVIGNPGLGATILDYTMTEGIVSSPNRDFDGQPFIQTSAQVNPGSSGAPMFDSNGLVIGIVVLKGRIEGAGFAIPADDIMGFLLGAATAQGADGKLVRCWTDSSGSRHIEASLGGFDGGVVKLEKADGQVVSLPLEKLSDSDQKFIRKVRAGLHGSEK